MLVQVRKFEEKRITGIWMPQDWLCAMVYDDMTGLEDAEIAKLNALEKQAHALIGAEGCWGDVNNDDDFWPELKQVHENITGMLCDCIECYYSVLEVKDDRQVNIGV